MYDGGQCTACDKATACLTEIWFVHSTVRLLLCDDCYDEVGEQFRHGYVSIDELAEL